MVVVRSNQIKTMLWSMGHCDPKIMKTLQEQLERLTLSSRAFYNDRFPVFADYLTSMFGYDMVLPLNTAAEAVEQSCQENGVMRRKKIPKNEVEFEETLMGS